MVDRDALEVRIAKVEERQRSDLERLGRVEKLIEETKSQVEHDRTAFTRVANDLRAGITNSLNSIAKLDTSIKAIEDRFKRFDGSIDWIARNGRRLVGAIIVAAATAWISLLVQNYTLHQATQETQQQVIRQLHSVGP